ncbi:MAG TPA: hypothetical protein QGH10_25980 [Armatimonadota bacterium]|nr:hypothetical protein [Armatimonadota bacterium]
MPSLKRHVPMVLAGTIAVALIAVWFSGCKLGAGPDLPVTYHPDEADPQFADMEGDPDEDLVEGLARLGILPQGGGRFLPDDAIERGDYIVWLVRASDIIWRDEPSRRIHLTEKQIESVTPTFSDLQANVNYFPYIQGMVESGHIVGFDQGSYEYARAITREHVVLLRAGVTLGTENVVAPPEDFPSLRILLKSFLDDADRVTDEYLAAVLADLTQPESDTISLAFGDNIKELHPRKTVSRREAARTLTNIGGRTWQAAESISPLMRPLPESIKKQLQDEADAAAEADSHDGHNH